MSNLTLTGCCFIVYLLSVIRICRYNKVLNIYKNKIQDRKNLLEVNLQPNIFFFYAKTDDLSTTKMNSHIVEEKQLGSASNPRKTVSTP